MNNKYWENKAKLRLADIEKLMPAGSKVKINLFEFPNPEFRGKEVESYKYGSLDGQVFTVLYRAGAFFILDIPALNGSNDNYVFFRNLEPIQE